MSYSAEWERRYIENTHMAIWPWTDVVSLVHRYCKPMIAESKGNVYEVGCGAGANVPFFKALGIDYFGTDGSVTAVSRLHRSYPELEANILALDFTQELPFEVQFDLIVDRASLTHNDTESIKRALDLLFYALKPGGVFVGVDWFSTSDSAFAGPEIATDKHTKKGFGDGRFAGTGLVHFSDEIHLRDLFSKFELVHLEEKITQRYVPVTGSQSATWNLVARRS